MLQLSRILETNDSKVPSIVRSTTLGRCWGCWNENCEGVDEPGLLEVEVDVGADLTIFTDLSLASKRTARSFMATMGSNMELKAVVVWTCGMECLIERGR